jgi:hypothetical protein
MTTAVRYAVQGGEDIVALSYRRFAPIWAFRLIDAVAEVTNPAVASGVTGTTRVVAEMSIGDRELATFRNSAGLLIPRTRTVADPTPDDPNTIPTSQLVALTGGLLDPGQINAVRLENTAYEPVKYLRSNLKDRQITDARMRPAGLGPLLDLGAFVLGQAPARKFSPQSKVRIAAPSVPGKGASARLDSELRFALWGDVRRFFPNNAATSRLGLEIDTAAQGKLRLTYRITRDESGDLTGTLPGSNNTPRTKLIRVVPPNNSTIAARDVPPLYLLLN